MSRAAIVGPIDEVRDQNDEQRSAYAQADEPPVGQHIAHLADGPIEEREQRDRDDGSETLAHAHGPIIAWTSKTATAMPSPKASRHMTIRLARSTFTASVPLRRGAWSRHV